MPPVIESPRLAWFTASLSEQRDKIASLLGRLGCMDLRGCGRKPGTDAFRKFTDLIRQVASARDEEDHIMCQIEEVERQHRVQRANHNLACAKAASDDECDPDYEAKRPERNLWWFIVFLYLMAQKPFRDRQPD